MERETPAAVIAFEKSDYSRDDHRIEFPPECIPLLTDGISLILSRWVKLQAVVARKLHYWFGLAEYIRLSSGKVKHEEVEKMAADILAFFLQPKGRCSVGHVHILLQDLMLITFRCSTIGYEAAREVAEKLFNLHQDLSQGKYDAVENLRKTLTWIGIDQLEQYRKSGEEELIAAHRANKRRKIFKRQRQKFRAYFV